MEAKLAEFRARKAKERKNADTIWQKTVRLFWRTSTPANASVGETPEKQQRKTGQPHRQRPHHLTQSTEYTDDEDLFDEETDDQPPPEKFTRLLIILKIILWLLLWAIAIQVEFGAVYFAMSTLAFIYVNTRTGRRRRQGLSAYSVFNPQCERLTGTLTAEQLEQNLLHRRPQVQS